MVVLSGTSLADSFLHWVSFKNILRRIWRLPRNCHTRILHKVAYLDSVFNRLICLSDHSSRKTCESNSYLLNDSLTLFNTNVFTPVGSNHYCACSQICDIAGTLRKTLFVLTLQDTCTAVTHCYLQPR